jgi:hypothetical protein
MPNLPKITTIKAECHGMYRPAFEVVESEDGVHVVIREAGNRERQIRLERAALPSLLNALRKIRSGEQQRH